MILKTDADLPEIVRVRDGGEQADLARPVTVKEERLSSCQGDVVANVRHAECRSFSQPSHNFSTFVEDRMMTTAPGFVKTEPDGARVDTSTCSMTSSPASRRFTSSRRKGHIKRPMNAFMVWSKDARKRLAVVYPLASNGELSQALGREWKAMSDDDKQRYIDEADRLRQLHRLQHPEYKYRPRPPRRRGCFPKVNYEDMNIPLTKVEVEGGFPIITSCLANNVGVKSEMRSRHESWPPSSAAGQEMMSTAEALSKASVSDLLAALSCKLTGSADLATNSQGAPLTDMKPTIPNNSTFINSESSTSPESPLTPGEVTSGDFPEADTGLFDMSDLMTGMDLEQSDLDACLSSEEHLDSFLCQSSPELDATSRIMWSAPPQTYAQQQDVSQDLYNIA